MNPIARSIPVALVLAGQATELGPEPRPLGDAVQAELARRRPTLLDDPADIRRALRRMRTS